MIDSITLFHRFREDEQPLTDKEKEIIRLLEGDEQPLTAKTAAGNRSASANNRKISSFTNNLFGCKLKKPRKGLTKEQLDERAEKVFKQYKEADFRVTNLDW